MGDFTLTRARIRRADGDAKKACFSKLSVFQSCAPTAARKFARIFGEVVAPQ